jgi:1-acyl-sn-glycerol-3-phosphate acyltransferase
MKLLTSIFARFWAAWGLLSFIASFLLIFIPSMFTYLFKDKKKGQEYFIKVSKIWMSVWLFLIGCSVRVSGKENFKPGENYVVTFNHNALLDVPLSSPFVPAANKTIAKASFAKVPLFGWFYSLGAVLVDRKNEQSRVKSFDAMKSVLASGIHMSVYPEGTRNRTNDLLKPFYDGAFKLAIECNKEIIPCIITGTKKAMPIHETFYLLPTRLGMHFLPPVSSKGMDVKELNRKVFKIMWDQYEKEM